MFAVQNTNDMKWIAAALNKTKVKLLNPTNIPLVVALKTTEPYPTSLVFLTEYNQQR